jgi:hypothetical protein
MAAAVILVAVAAAAVWMFALSGDDKGSRDTADLPPPRADQARATLAYLDDEGAALLRMHETATDDSLGDGPARCEEVAQDLDTDVRPDRAAGLTSRVVDEPMRAAFGEELLALGLALTRCIDRGGATADEDRLTRATDLTSQRLDELREAAR